MEAELSIWSVCGVNSTGHVQNVLSHHAHANPNFSIISLQDHAY